MRATIATQIRFLSEILRLNRAEYDRYRGQDVVLVDGQVLGAGRTAKQALAQALRKRPGLKLDEIAFYYIPRGDELVL